MKLLYPAILMIIIPTFFAAAQQNKESATASGSHFKISGSRSFWMGSNYRKEWNTPISVPILNLATEKGGLRPVKRGGGKQTKSLRLVNANGREYTIRSIQKFITSKTLPGDLQSEAAADLVADGVSASYPYAALSMPILSDAAGVPHGNPRLVYITDDPLLGEYRQEFANMMVLFEERIPDSVKKDFSTDEVADKLKDDNDNEVDQHAMLRARILDMFVMDLDRHEDQWIWGAYDKGKGKVFYPIARDRDQAFYTNRGLLPGIAKWPWLVPQLEGLKAKPNNINRFNFAARNLDRFFLNKLNEKDWRQATEKFLSQMTDVVIEKALKQQPPEIAGMSTDKIIVILKERRKFLALEMMQYYQFLSAYVDITGSDKSERFEITRNEDGSVQLRVFKITKEGAQSFVKYERSFDPATTRELRLYGLKDDDEFIIQGNNDKIKIRMIGGGGQDEFKNATSGNGGYVYDEPGKDNKITGQFKNKMSHDTAINNFNRIYYKYNQVIPFISATYNQDDGLFLGASLKIIRHGFRKDPYKAMHQLFVNHALSTKSYNFRWYSEFIGVFGKKSDLLFDADLKAPNNTTNFFGYGLNTVYNKNSPGKYKYYRARYDLGDFSLLVRKNFSEKVKLILGPTFQFFSLDSNKNMNRFILTTVPAILNPNTLFLKQSYIGAKLAVIADTRDNPVLPRKGIVWATTLRYLDGQNSASNNVTQLNSEFTFYLPLSKGIVWTNRFGGGRNWGTFEFFQSQYLGSEDNLRGYRKYRFAGRSKIYNNTELRMKVANFRTYLFPGSMGLLFFFDSGNIKADNISNTKWVSGYGGGLWFSPLSRIVITFSYAASKEDKLPLIGLGWKF